MTESNVDHADTMTWMTVGEAAAVLGVSERTILRRVKAATIESREVDGRTMVCIDHVEQMDPSGVSGRELSPVETARLSRIAAAQLHMRRLDADAISDALSVLSDYRLSFDEQITRSRRTTRVTLAFAAVLLIALGAAAWYHATTIADLRQDETKAMFELERTHQEQAGKLAIEREKALAQYESRSAHAQGLAEARAKEIERTQQAVTEREQQLAQAHAEREVLRSKMDDQVASFQTTLTSQEASREKLQTGLQEQLTAAQATLARQLAAIESRDQEISALRKEITQLRGELVEKASTYQTLREQSERVTAAIRRSAARSIGQAEGMRLHIAEQQEALRALRERLAEAIAASPDERAQEQGDDPRQEIWESLLNGQDVNGSGPQPPARPAGSGESSGDQSFLHENATGDASSRPGEGPWSSMLKACARMWMLGPSTEVAGSGRE
jgi:excisionase family DNA binding protein